MTKLLVLEASIFPPNVSASRRVTSQFVERWKARDPDALIIHRDLAAKPLNHIGLDLMAGSAMPPERRNEAESRAVEISQILIDELFSADVLVIGAPMYNFSIPSTLKAWIDNISIAGKTWAHTPEGRPQGLVKGKRVLLVASRGGDYTAGPTVSLNFQDTYLRGALGLLGMTDLTVIPVEKQKRAPAEQAEGMAQAESRVAEL